MPKVEQHRILIVDDDEATRYMITRTLERAGYHVTEAATGQEGLSKISLRPDLIIMDVQLPDMNGLEISRMLRNDPATSLIPILQVSATYTQSVDKAKGLDAGADSYLATPIDPEELLANIRMLLRLRQAQDALARGNLRMQSVLSNICDVYIALDLDWGFLQVNPKAERLLERPLSELQGKMIWDLYPEIRTAKLGASLQEAVETGQPVHFETESVRHPGTWWEGHIHPADDRIEIYFREITERKVFEKHLAEARDLLSRQNELLEERVRERTAKLQETISDLETFSYSITHDMRAPLRAMQGFAKILLEDHIGQLNQEGQDYLQRIAAGAQRLDLLIRDVLSYSNIVRTKLTLVPVDADKLVRDLIRDYPEFQKLRAEITIIKSLPTVLGNEAFLAQVFSNLLGNAVKFVAQSTIPRVEIRTESKGEKLVRIIVQDNGIGIPEKHQSALFKLFHRAQTEFPGTGIGLAVVRKAVERMGGRVGLESQEGRGSMFWVELQLP